MKIMVRFRRSAPSPLTHAMALGLFFAGCGDSTSEKIDAGKRKYCDAYCADSSTADGRAMDAWDAKYTSDSQGAMDTPSSDSDPPRVDTAQVLDTKMDTFPEAFATTDTGSQDLGPADILARDTLPADSPQLPPDTAIPEDTAKPKDTLADFVVDSRPDLLPDLSPDLHFDSLPLDSLPLDSLPHLDAVPTDVLIADAPTTSDAPLAMTCPIPSKARDIATKAVSPGLAHATASDGTLWIVGNIVGVFGSGSVFQPNPIDLGNGKIIRSSYMSDIFLAKLDPATLLATGAWSFGDYGNGATASPPGAGEQFASTIAVAAGGQVGILGNFAGEIDFTPNNLDGSGPSGTPGIAGQDFLSSTSSVDFYAIFDNTGAPIKSHMANVGAGLLYSIGSNPTQNAFVVCGKTTALVPNYNVAIGTNKGILKIPTDATYTNAFGGGTDIVVAKIDATTGQVIWGRQIGGVGIQTCRAVGLDNNGDVILTGIYNGDLDFGGATTAQPTLGTSSTIGVMYVAKLASATGTAVAAKSFGSTGVNTPNAITVDATSNILLTGAISVNTDFGNGVAIPALGLDDAFVAKFNPSLNAQWAKSFGDAPYNQRAFTVAATASGDVYLGGSYVGNLGSLGLTSTAISNGDAFVARLSGIDGSTQCKWSFGDAPGVQGVNSLTVARTAASPLVDRVVFAGNFASAINFGTAGSFTTPAAGIDHSYFTTLSQ